MKDDEQHDPETAMERFENLLGRIMSAGKKTCEKPSSAPKKSWMRALGPPPATGPGLADEED